MLVSVEIREQKLSGIEPRAYDEEVDDVTAIFIDICEDLANADAAQFRVSGFGQDPWPVDVRTDLPVLLEQLPRAIVASTEPLSAFSLDFYEQGIERQLMFTPHDREFSVTCESATDWRPEPAQEQIETALLREQLVTIRDAFLNLIRTIAPEVRGHKLVREWASEAGAEEP